MWVHARVPVVKTHSTLRAVLHPRGSGLDSTGIFHVQDRCWAVPNNFLSACLSYTLRLDSPNIKQEQVPSLTCPGDTLSKDEIMSVATHPPPGRQLQTVHF